MKDKQKDQQNENILLKLEKKQPHQYQANRKNQVPSSGKSSSDNPSDKSSSVEKDLNKKLRDTDGYTGY